MTELRRRSGVAWKRKDRPDLIQIVDDGFILGTTEPTWANSGSRIPQANLLRNETINLVTSADGQVISGLHLPYGRIEVRHKNVTIRDCIINIGWAPDGTGPGQRPRIQNNAAVVTNANYDSSGLNMEFVTCDPINAGANGTADDWDVSAFYFFSGARVYRCSARNVTDSFMPDEKPSTPAAPVQILGCYSSTRYLPVADQADGTHNDGVQLAGGDRHIIRGNALHNPTGGVIYPGTTFKVLGQCVVFTPYHSIISNATLDQNWFYGAYTQVSVWPAVSYGYGGGDCPGTTITNNRFGGQCVWPILMNPQSNTSKTLISGNVAGPGGLIWNNGTLAPGAAIPVTVASNP